MNPHDRIIVDPDILVGKPVVKDFDFRRALVRRASAESGVLVCRREGCLGVRR